MSERHRKIDPAVPVLPVTLGEGDGASLVEDRTPAGPGFPGEPITMSSEPTVASWEGKSRKATLRGFAALVACVGKGDLRDAAVQALGRMGDSETCRELAGFPPGGHGAEVSVTGRDAERDESEPLELALERVFQGGAEEPGRLVLALLERLERREVEELLARFLRNPHWRVRAGAAVCLDYLGSVPQGMDLIYYWTAKGEWNKCARVGRAALEALLSLLHPGQDEQALESAMSVAAETGDFRVVGILAGLAEGGDVATRRAAARALGKTGSRKAVEPLVGLLGDEDPLVAEEAGRSLASLGEFSVEALAELLAEDDERLRQRAVELLSVLGEDDRVEPLVKQVLLSRMKDGDRALRNRIASSLAHASGRWAVEVLIEALYYYHVRGVAHRALLQKGREAVDQLVEALRHRHIFVRREVALILGELGDPRAWDALQAATRDRDWHVREAATKALSMLESRYSLIQEGEVVRVVQVNALPGGTSSGAPGRPGMKGTTPQEPEALGTGSPEVAFSSERGPDSPSTGSRAPSHGIKGLLRQGPFPRQPLHQR